MNTTKKYNDEELLAIAKSIEFDFGKDGIKYIYYKYSRKEADILCKYLYNISFYFFKKNCCTKRDSH